MNNLVLMKNIRIDCVPKVANVDPQDPTGVGANTLSVKFYLGVCESTADF